MPEDIPKAVMALIWLLSGVIVFGWLLMEYAGMVPFVFALFFFGIPVFVSKKLLKRKV